MSERETYTVTRRKLRGKLHVVTISRSRYAGLERNCTCLQHTPYTVQDCTCQGWRKRGRCWARAQMVDNLRERGLS